MNIDITQIILGITTLLSMCGWFVNGRKHKKEVKNIDADIKKKELELGLQYIDEFKEDIVKPLKDELFYLRKQVSSLQEAIGKIYNCEFIDGCPVRNELRKQKESQNNNNDKGHNISV